MVRVRSLADIDNIAEAAVNPNPNRPFEFQAAQQLRQVCDNFANGPDWARSPAFRFGDSILSPYGSINTACSPYWASQGVDGPDFEPEFSGGQCPTVYLVDLVNSGDTGPGSTQAFVEGPVRRVRQEPGIQAGTINVLVEGGNTVQFRVGNVGENWSITGTTRIDGQPDNCGDGPVIPVPGPNPPNDPGLPPERRPFIDVDGALVIPIVPVFVDVNLPDVEIPVDFGFDPQVDVNLGGGGGSSGDGQPSDGEGVGEGETGEDGGESTGDGQDVDFGEPPEGRVWVGAIVSVVAPSGVGNIPGSGPQNRAYPRVIGNASLIYGEVRGKAHRIESEWLELVRPTTVLEVTGCRVNLIAGSTYEVRPLSAPICPENACNGE